MNAKHPWVDPEQIRQLAERLMAPYAGLSATAAEVETAPPAPIVPDAPASLAPGEAVFPTTSAAAGLFGTIGPCLDPEAAKAWRRQATKPLGQSHPLRQTLASQLPAATLKLCGRDNQPIFDDGVFSCFDYLIEELRQTNPPGVWVRFRVMATETLHATVIETSRGSAVLLMRYPNPSPSADALRTLAGTCIKHLSEI